MKWKLGCSMIVTCLLLFSALHSIEASNYSNARIHWGFKKSVDHESPSAGNHLDKLLAEYNSVYLGDPSKKEIYLTFDNGYENGYTSPILDVLKKKKVPATFFVTGHYLKSQPDLIKRMDAEGHIIGNHSWHHPDLTKVSDVRLKNELELVREEFEKLTGKKGMQYLRAPRGIFSERTLALSGQLGYTNIFWSLAFVDWKIDQQQGWMHSYNQVMKQIHPGSILLMHTVSKDNSIAMEKIITDLQAQGYVFKSLDDLMMKRVMPHQWIFGYDDVKEMDSVDVLS
ncbi:delta-lactam-biosynthetic de-N-acetylase [Bacillus sp. DJP31]|uniref:delta-lactam-biosynthetic de-N-acetylase n=1 Tax=Bacillus sp. DJP31 TaxID=3409789 RepID=UPI003BB675E2